MKHSAVDIANRTFARTMMGLDSHEVYNFLRDVADNFEEVSRERDQFKKELRSMKDKIVDFEDRDASMRSTIQAASKMSDQFRQDAEREASLIIADAKHRTEIMLKDARDSLKETYKEIADLKRLRLAFEANLKSLLESHLTMIKQGRDVFKDPEFKMDQEPAAAEDLSESEDMQVQELTGLPLGPEGNA